MERKIMQWKARGMNQDVSASAFSNEFAFENHNLRLSTNDNNTLMSWVNERGTLEMRIIDNGGNELTLQGTPIGTAVINNQLVLFTTEGVNSDNDKSEDRIYVLKYGSDQSYLIGDCLYEGHLNLDAGSPLETLISYESDTIQKVYWTDGRNQPRVINIAASKDKIARWNHYGEASATVDTFFDFVPCVQLNETVTIEKIIGGGTFAPGTIQYCFTYINKFHQQSNVVYQSPLYYLTYEDRGAAPDDKVTNGFRITISNLDTNFDCVRLYSVQRTTTNDVPYVRLISDIEIGSQESVTYLDNGTTGSNLDPTELLYVGGKEITALTMAAKDQTLFLGNLTEENSSIDKLQDHFLRNPVEITYKRGSDGFKIYDIDKPAGTYAKSFTLNNNQRQITTFKGGEKYRFGFQLQKDTGEWSQPIFLNDVENQLYPSATDAEVSLVYAESDSMILPDYGELIKTYKMIRPVIVFPNMNDRQVLCQGVLNPTVFNIYNRVKNKPFAQASWFFRPYCSIVTPGGDSEEGLISDVDYVTADYLKNLELKGSYHILVANIQANDAAALKVTLDNLGTTLTFTDTSGDETVTSTEVYEHYIYLGRAKDRSGSVIQDTYTYAFIRDSGMWPGTQTSKGNIDDDDTSYKISSSNAYTFSSVYRGHFEYRAKSTNVNVYEFGTRGYFDSRSREAVYNVSLDTGGLPSITFRFCHEGPMVNPSATNWNEATDKWKFYNLTFVNQAIVNSSDSTSSTSTEGDVTAVDAGSSVVFQHYATLPAAVDSKTDVEIHGSVNRYVTPYDSAEDAPVDEARSNNQFFVDQSIVTLNSPDLEFDTAVQSWGTEGLKLRIVGMIPIHASISSHNIVVKSNMLSLDYDSDGSSVDNLKNVRFGVGDRDYNILHSYKDMLAGQRLVADYLWNDAYLDVETKILDGNETDVIVTGEDAVDYLIYPWHKSGSLINDQRNLSDAASVLDTKKEASLLFSGSTTYLPNTQFKEYSTHSFFHLTENSYVHNIRLKKQIDDFESELNYYPNVDTVLYNESKYPTYVNGLPSSDLFMTVNNPVLMKYKSTTHAVVALVPDTSEPNKVPILPSASGLLSSRYNTAIGGGNNYKTLWKDIVEFAAQEEITTGPIVYHFLWLGELYKEPVNQFGSVDGKVTKESIRSNVWIVGGDAIDLRKAGQGLKLRWTEGDTYYQRYDCLKTYPFTTDDPNQLVEILSFMCETRVNIDGRYDKNRGQKDNTNMSPQNFNLLNPAYTQHNNFFSYMQLDNEDNPIQEYPNRIYFTKTKTSGADIDLWTNVSLGSTLELEGDKGYVSKLTKANDALLAFQETGISQIMYNENVQIATQQGVPIEIANSGKVQGVRYLSDSVGCSNKWSVANTPNGIYFIDSHNKELYFFNGKLENISTTNGFNTWMKKNVPASEILWNPVDFRNIVTYYDKLNHDVMFINDDTCLNFSEKSGTFTSFYDYGDVPYFCNLLDTGLWITKNGIIHRHQAGNYCEFFGEPKPYWTTMIANADGTTDKLFTNLEFTASVDGDGDYIKGKPFSFSLPFDYVESWNDYQHGILNLKQMNGTDGMKHFTPSVNTTVALKRKFRLWRCDVPRDNAPLESDAGMNISRYAPRPLDRMRNPWIYFKLQKNADDSQNRTEIHNILMTYYV